MDEAQRRRLILDYIAQHPRCHVREVIAEVKPMMSTKAALRCIHLLEAEGAIIVDVQIVHHNFRVHILEVAP